MSADILLKDDGGGYYLMRGESEAGRAFVKAHSLRLDHNQEVSIGLLELSPDHRGCRGGRPECAGVVMSAYTRPKRKRLSSGNKAGAWPSARRQKIALAVAQRQRALRGTR